MKITSAKRNSGRKSTLVERDCYTMKSIVSKNHRTTAAWLTAKFLNPEDPVSIKAV
jgi:hypothetical protein